MIPKNIYQTFYAGYKLPDVIDNRVAAMRARNPNWNYTRFDDEGVEAFMRAYSWPELLKQYRRLTTPITRIDVFKYLLIYRLGGVYLDIKSTALMAFDNVFYPHDHYILTGWCDPASPDCFNAREYMQWCIMAEPYHPYLRAVLDAITVNIDQYNVKRCGVGKPAVLALTGPYVYTDTIRSIETQHPHRHALYMTDLRLRYTVLDHAQSHERLFHNHYTLNVHPLVSQ